MVTRRHFSQKPNPIATVSDLSASSALPIEDSGRAPSPSLQPPFDPIIPEPEPPPIELDHDLDHPPPQEIPPVPLNAVNFALGPVAGFPDVLPDPPSPTVHGV